MANIGEWVQAVGIEHGQYPYFQADVVSRYPAESIVEAGRQVLGNVLHANRSHGEYALNPPLTQAMAKQISKEVGQPGDSPERRVEMRVALTAVAVYGQMFRPDIG